MIISDGSTSYTFEGEQIDDERIVEKASTRTSTGRIRSQVNGKRYAAKVGIRCNATIYGQITDLLTNQANFYYFTPTTIPDDLSASDFPMAVDIDGPSKKRQAGGGEKKYYIEFEVQGVNLLE